MSLKPCSLCRWMSLVCTVKTLDGVPSALALMLLVDCMSWPYLKKMQSQMIYTDTTWHSFCRWNHQLSIENEWDHVTACRWWCEQGLSVFQRKLTFMVRSSLPRETLTLIGGRCRLVSWVSTVALIAFCYGETTSLSSNAWWPCHSKPVRLSFFHRTQK